MGESPIEKTFTSDGVERRALIYRWPGPGIKGDDLLAIYEPDLRVYRRGDDLIVVSDGEHKRASEPGWEPIFR